MNTIIISYKYKGSNLQSINYTSKEDMIPYWIETGMEEIEQYIRESILDECIGWEKAMEKEEKVFSHFEKNKKIEIIKES